MARRAGRRARPAPDGPLTEVFEPFIKEAPLCVLARGASQTCAGRTGALPPACRSVSPEFTDAEVARVLRAIASPV